MFRKSLIIALGLTLFLAGGCSNKTPTAPIADATQDENMYSAQWASGDIVYVRKSTSTNRWGFYKKGLELFGRETHLFTLPATQTGDILALDYHDNKGFVLIQEISSIYSRVFTVSVNGSNLTERNIHPSAFMKKFPRWSTTGALLSVDSNYGGQGMDINIYNSSLSDPAQSTFSGSSVVFVSFDRVVYYEYGIILHGTGKLPDRIMTADSDGSGQSQLLQETGWPRDVYVDNILLYVYGPDGINGGYTSYGIKTKNLHEPSDPVVIKNNIPINSRIPNVRYTENGNHIIYETTNGIYQMSNNGEYSQKIANGLFPVVIH